MLTLIDYRLLLSAGLLFAASALRAEDLDVRGFADCVTDSGAKYYGAHWCPYCKKQNALFGNSLKYAPYVECSPKGSRNKLKRCSHVTAYPTWTFANGEQRSSVVSLEQLSQDTGCRLEEKNYFVD